MICTIDRTDLLQFLFACCEIVEVLELCDKFLVVVAADSNNLSEDLDGLCGLCCVFHFSLLSAPQGGLRLMSFFLRDMRTPKPCEVAKQTNQLCLEDANP